MNKKLVVLLSVYVLASIILSTCGQSNTPHPTEVTDPEGGTMRLIPAGTFMMGSDANAALAECNKYQNRGPCDRDKFLDEEPLHEVHIDAFYMDMYEVTNAQYAECVAAGECSVPSDDRSWTHRSYYGNPTYENYPVIYVSWYQASEYCTWRGGRLPAEAEWEYAARGGLEGMMYPWGDESPVCTAGATNGANCSSCSPDDTVAVGAYAPNGYGLYDMAGNVWEWVSDWYGDYPSGTVADPAGPSSGSSRVLRGGSWNYYVSDLRVANRDSAGPDLSGNGLGFRCAASITSTYSPGWLYAERVRHLP